MIPFDQLKNEIRIVQGLVKHISENNDKDYGNELLCKIPDILDTINKRIDNLESNREYDKVLINLPDERFVRA